MDVKTVAVDPALRVAETRRLIEFFRLGPIAELDTGAHVSVDVGTVATHSVPSVASDGPVSGGCAVTDSSTTCRTTPRLVSLHMLEFTPVANVTTEPVCVHLAGTDTITESMCSSKFAISPQSFFQVNAASAAMAAGTVHSSEEQLANQDASMCQPPGEHARC